MSSRLDQAKSVIKAKIVAGTASGINGVGVDPEREKLLVFYTDRGEALKTVQSIEPSCSDIAELHPGGTPEGGRVSRASLRGFFGKLFAVFKKKFRLRPVSVIKPDSGDQGRMGCFVQHADGAKGSLTVEHIFSLRKTHRVDVRESLPNNFIPAGESWLFGGLKTGSGQHNLADCALFLPDLDKVDLKGDGRISGDYIKKADIAQTVKRKIVNLSSPNGGSVVDVGAMISYSVFFHGVGVKRVIFDDQILVRGQGFGQWGDSGAIVVMAQTEPDRGDALGLYSYTTAEGRFHYVTPAYACFDLLKVSGIYNPP